MHCMANEETLDRLRKVIVCLARTIYVGYWHGMQNYVLNSAQKMLFESCGYFLPTSKG